MKTFTPSVKPHLPHIFNYFLSDCISLFKRVLVSPILKVKIKNQKNSLEPLSLSSLSPRQCSSLLHGHISQKSYLKQAVSISSHSIFSQFPCILKFHPCQRKSTETVFVIITLYVATSDKNVHVFIFMRLFVLFAQSSKLSIAYHFLLYIPSGSKQHDFLSQQPLSFHPCPASPLPF